MRSPRLQSSPNPVLGCDPHLEDEAHETARVYHPTRQHCRRPAIRPAAPQGGWMRCAGVLLSGAEGDPEVLKPRKSLASRKMIRIERADGKSCGGRINGDPTRTRCNDSSAARGTDVTRHPVGRAGTSANNHRRMGLGESASVA